jgi:hypothetical protein
VNLNALRVEQNDAVSIRLRAEDRAGQFALSPPLQLTITSSTTQPTDAPIVTGQPATAPPADAAAPIDPAGYSGALKAYFDAIRSGNYDRGPNTAK